MERSAASNTFTEHSEPWDECADAWILLFQSAAASAALRMSTFMKFGPVQRFSFRFFQMDRATLSSGKIFKKKPVIQTRIAHEKRRRCKRNPALDLLCLMLAG